MAVGPGYIDIPLTLTACGLGALLFLMPYVAWSQGLIPNYKLAFLCAVAIAAVDVVVVNRVVRRFNAPAHAIPG